MRTIIILFVGFITQIIITKYFSYGGVGVNLLLLLTIEFSIIKGARYGEVFGFFSGLLQDIFSIGIIGARALTGTCTGFFVGGLKSKCDTHNIFFQIFITIVIFIIQGFLVYFIRLMFSYPAMMLKNIFINAVLNGLLAPVLYFLINKVSAR